MVQVNINTKMVIYLKVNTLKMRNVAMVNTYFHKVVYYNHNSTLIPVRYVKYYFPMAQYTSDNRRMDLVKAVVSQLTLMAVFMKENGKMIKNKEMDYSNILIIQNMMENGIMI